MENKHRPTEPWPLLKAKIALVLRQVGEARRQRASAKDSPAEPAPLASEQTTDERADRLAQAGADTLNRKFGPAQNAHVQ